MTGEHTNRVALVTGGGKGLGREVAIELAKEGATLIINYRSDKRSAEETLSMVRKYGQNSQIVQADVTQPSDVDRLFGGIRSDYGEVDILINNVGDFIFKPLMETSDMEFTDTIESNLYAAFFCSRRALGAMNSGYGRVINIGAVGADRLLLRKRTAPYYIAKTGLFMLTKIMSLECSQGVTVNMISPGVLPNGIRPEGARVVDYEDVTRAVLFLVGGGAGEVNGANIEVSGGWSLGMS
jgi:3-oxoacyl-[acyl-carrier protein] reductase